MMCGKPVRRRVAHPAGGVDHVEHGREVEPGLARRDHYLGGRRERHRVQEVVQQLGGVPGAARAHQHDLRRDRPEHPAHRLQRRGGTADHDRQRPLLCGCRPAGDPRVQVLDPAFGERGVDPLRRGRRGRRQVDDHLPRPREREQPVRGRPRAEHHGLHGSAIRQRQQHRLGPVADVPELFRRDNASGRRLPDPHVIPDDKDPGRDQSPRHPTAHVAEPDKPDLPSAHGLRHRRSSLSG